MLENLLDPVVLMFAAGLLAGALRSDLRLPEALYESLSIYLLLAIGLKGGVELTKSPLAALAGPAAGALALGVTIPIVAYGFLKIVGHLNRADAAAIAAHYGSVSAVTFAVTLAYLARSGETYENYVTVLLVLMEIPAIGVGIFLARVGRQKGAAAGAGIRWGALLHEIVLGKSVFLLLAGLAVGAAAGADGMKPVEPLFVGLFKGALAFFLLEMGLVASRRLRDLRRMGPFLLAFGIGMPLVSGAMGAAVGAATGLSVGGTAVLATLAASSSYIAAPAAMRLALPEANPTLYLTASLGVTFPFNIVFGIPIYYWMAGLIHQ